LYETYNCHLEKYCNYKMKPDYWLIIADGSEDVDGECR